MGWEQVLTILGSMGFIFVLTRQDMAKMDKNHREDMAKMDEKWERLFSLFVEKK